MDFSTSIAGLIMMEGVPIYEALEQADWRFAKDWWQWFFFAQTEKAEAAMRADPELWHPQDAALGEENAADYLAASLNPTVVRGMLADYRAGLEFEYDHDKADRKASRRLQCPLGLLWAAHDDRERFCSNPAKPWVEWSSQIVLKQRDGCPVCGTGVVTRKEGILSVQGDGADSVLDGIVVHLDAAVGDEQAKASPRSCDILQRLAQGSLSRDAGAVVGEPGLEGGDLWRRLVLANGEAGLWCQPPDLCPDPVKLSDTLETVLGDRRGAVSGGFKQFTAGVGPTIGKLDGGASPAGWSASASPD